MSDEPSDAPPVRQDYKCASCDARVTAGVRCSGCRARLRAERAAAAAVTPLSTRARVVVPVGRALTTGQVARLCGVAARTASQWIDAGRLQGYRLPGSQDRRVHADDLVRFMRKHGIAVPPGLVPGDDVCIGVREPVPGFAPVSQVDLGMRLAAGAVRSVVVGDADGVGSAVSVAAAVRAANPALRIALLLDPANAGFAPPAGLFDVVRILPCDLSTLGIELGGTS